LQSVKTAIDLITLFLQKNNVIISLDNIILRLLKRSMRYINSQKNDADRKKLFRIIPTFFEANIILEYVSDREDYYNKKLLSLFLSKDYRLGKSILHPFRRLKLLFKK